MAPLVWPPAHQPGPEDRGSGWVVCAFPKERIKQKRDNVPATVLRSRCQSSLDCVPATLILLLKDPGQGLWRDVPGWGTAGSALSCTHPPERQWRGQGRRRPGEGAEGGGEEAPGRGGRGAADAEARDAQGGRRLGAAAGRGALEARQARGGSRELHEVPPGLRTGRWLGEAVGGAPTFMARRGPRRRARSKSGLGGWGWGVGRAGRGRPESGRRGLGARPGRARLPRLRVSLRRLLGALWSRQPRCRSVRWLFWKLANVFVEEGRGERGSDRNRAWGRWNSRGQSRGARGGWVVGGR